MTKIIKCILLKNKNLLKNMKIFGVKKTFIKHINPFKIGIKKI